MDTRQIREDTPHCKDKLFLNSAGSSLMPIPVTQAIIDYLKEEEKIGGYKLRELKHAEIEEFYNEAARLINCNPANIAFTHDATDAFTKALSSIVFNPGDMIITTDDDYVSNHLNFLSLQQRYGIKISRIRNYENGDIDIEDFEHLIKKNRPKLVSVTHMPTNSGLVQNAEKIGEICRQYDLLYIVDACQSVGQLPVDIKKLKCDFLSVTGRKFLRGPRGSGFLFVSDRLLSKDYAPLYVDLHGATWLEQDKFQIINSAKRFEMWEKPYALVIGLKEALKYVNNIGIENIEWYNKKIKDRLKDRLSTIPGVLQFDKGTKTGNILTFLKKERSLQHTKDILDQHKVYYSISQKDGALIDYQKKGVDWTIRLSPHYFNTLDEMEQVASIVEII